MSLRRAVIQAIETFLILYSIVDIKSYAVQIDRNSSPEQTNY